MSKEAMKLALEALEYIEHNYMSLPAPAEKAITALREALAEPQEKYIYGTPLLDAMTGKANEALDRMAENARELGLDYEPVQDGGIVTAGGFDPRTQRTWVGLTDEEMDDCWNKLFGTGNYNRRNVYRAIEARLKEKNT